MAILVRLTLRKSLERVYGDPNSVFVTVGDEVLVRTENGLEKARILDKEKKVTAPKGSVFKIIRKLNAKDLEVLKNNLLKEREALKICMKNIKERDLDMKLTDVEYTYDRKKLFIYYTSEGRVDFRVLLKDLGVALKSKIQMVQIGVRDEAKMIGGLGNCGRELCCKTFIRTFDPVVIDMAKEQHLSLNPSKISGLCGRLVCCLGYENEFYKQVNMKMPKEGAKVNTPDGEGVVKSTNVLKEEVEILFDDGTVVNYKLEDLKTKKKSQKPVNETKE
ncbi:stage 0 sporulation family protein [bacterium]